MSGNTAMLMFLTCYETKSTGGNMPECELVCVIVATLLETNMQAK